MRTPLEPRLVLLDRDDTVSLDRPGYIRSPEDLELYPEAAGALARLARLGFCLAVVTNQSAVGRGLVSPEELRRIHDRLTSELARAGAPLAGVYHCPHRPEDGCGCRKPQPGLLRQAAADLGLTLSGSHLVGDAWSDVALGQAAGCRTVLVLTGRGGQALARVNGDPAVHVAEDLAAAAEWIADCERRSANGEPGTDAGRDDRGVVSKS